MNLYLDIDGVLVSNALGHQGSAARYAAEFLREATRQHDCFWLTTHCRGGENNAPHYLRHKLPPHAAQYVQLIKNTDWETWKTEAIDFSQDFLWLDDEVYQPELDELSKHGCLERLIRVDLRKHPDQLQDILREYF